MTLRPDSDRDDTDEQVLARRVAAGGAVGRVAEATLCRRFAPRVRLFACRHLRDAGEADDLVQDVLLHVVEALRRGAVEQPAQLASYVLGVSRNMIRQRARRTRRRDAILEARPAEAVVEEVRLAEVRPERLEDCLSAMRERERSLLRMSFCEERSGDEIALALGLSPGNVRVLRHRVLERLRGCLERDHPVLGR